MLAGAYPTHGNTIDIAQVNPKDCSVVGLVE